MINKPWTPKFKLLLQSILGCIEKMKHNKSASLFRLASHYEWGDSYLMSGLL